MEAKTKLNSVKVLVSKVSINWNISHDEFVSVKYGQKKYGHLKDELKNLRINKYFWCNKRNINLRKRVYWK